MPEELGALPKKLSIPCLTKPTTGGKTGTGLPMFSEPAPTILGSGGLSTFSELGPKAQAGNGAGGVDRGKGRKGRNSRIQSSSSSCPLIHRCIHLHSHASSNVNLHRIRRWARWPRTFGERPGRIIIRHVSTNVRATHGRKQTAAEAEGRAHTNPNSRFSTYPSIWLMT